MAEDYLTDDEQWEVIKRGIAENGVWILGGVVLGGALLFGWRYHQSHQNDVALRAAAQFGQMTGALEHEDHVRSRQLADGIVREFPGSPYADQARLTLARLDIDEGLLANAAAPLTQVMTASKDAELRHIARLRLARVLIDQGKPDEAIASLAADTSRAFASLTHEVRGDAFYAKKDFKTALTEYTAALSAGDAGSVNASLLELKIADLGVAPASLPATAMAPAATSSTKAKP